MEDPDIVAVVLTTGGRLDKALAAALPEALGLSRSRLKALIEAGAVTREGRPLTDPSASVGPGPVAIDLPPPAPAEAEPEAIPLVIVHEDADLVVVDKPAGLVVHPAPGAQRGTLVNALLHHCGDGLRGIGGVGRPGIVHRIDKDTSGLLVVAKTARAHAALSAQFAAHEVERRYDALVWGAPGPSPRLAGLAGVSIDGLGLRVDAAIGRHRTDRKRMAVVPGGRRAVTHLHLQERLGPGARIACRLETGRTHQIRVHCAHIGHPLVNDPVYGRARPRLPGSCGQALHAATLGFVHPDGRRLRFDSNPPSGFTQASEALRSIDLKPE